METERKWGSVGPACGSVLSASSPNSRFLHHRGKATWARTGKGYFFQALRMSLVKLSGLCFCALQSCEGALESRKLSPGGYFNIILQNADDN